MANFSSRFQSRFDREKELFGNADAYLNSTNEVNFNRKIQKAASDSDKYLERAEKFKNDNVEREYEALIDEIFFEEENIHNINENLFKDIQNVKIHDCKLFLCKGVRNQVETMIDNSFMYNVSLSLISNFKSKSVLKYADSELLKEIIHNPNNHSEILSAKLINFLSNKNYEINPEKLVNYIESNNSFLSANTESSYREAKLVNPSDIAHSQTAKESILSLFMGFGKFLPIIDCVAQIIFNKIVDKIKKEILDNNPDDLLEDISLDDGPIKSSKDTIKSIMENFSSSNSGNDGDMTISLMGDALDFSPVA